MGSVAGTPTLLFICTPEYTIFGLILIIATHPSGTSCEKNDQQSSSKDCSSCSRGEENRGSEARYQQ